MPADKAFYKKLLDELYDGVYFVDRDRQITYWNKAAERLTGYKADEVVGSCCRDNILVHVNADGENLCKDGCPLTEAMASGKPVQAEVYLHHKDGHRLPVSVRVTPIRNPKGMVIGAVEVFSDNSAKVAIAQRAQRLEKLAMRDTLTGLASRRFGETTLRTRLDEMQRYGWPFGVLMADIDMFKIVNDTHGHDVGDRVLRMVAKTLQRNVRSFDVVCRWGGEEFLAIIANIDRDALAAMADKLRLLVERSSISVDSHTIGITISVGTAIAKPDESVNALVKRADQLMYQSKAAGRNRVTVET